MIKLSDVSTERLITFLSYDQGKSEELNQAYLTLLRHSIKDFQTLKNMVKNGRKEFDNEFLKSAVIEVEKNIEHANNIGREPIILKTNNYEDSNVFPKTLRRTDKENSCEILLCKSPVITSSSKFGTIKDVSISEVKDLLGKVAGHDKPSAGNNAFMEKFRRFGNADVKMIRDAINFYEAQVLRQAKEIRKRNINLFTVNQKEKQLIVREQIKNIVKYLVENADICVWGELTPSQKTRLISAVTAYSGYENQVIRNRMINVISNYTTLSELEAGVVKQKTLDRFIIK